MDHRDPAFQRFQTLRFFLRLNGHENDFDRCEQVKRVNILTKRRNILTQRIVFAVQTVK